MIKGANETTTGAIEWDLSVWEGESVWEKERWEEKNVFEGRTAKRIVEWSEAGVGECVSKGER